MTTDLDLTAVAGASVLVVDDEPGIRELLCYDLEDLRYHVRAASSAERAIELLAAEDFDLVLCDVMMPGMSGIDLLRHIRERGLDTEVVVITGYPRMEDVVTCLRHGAFDYFRKPFERTEVQATVARAVERRRLRATQRLLDAGRRLQAATSGQSLDEEVVHCAVELLGADGGSLLRLVHDELEVAWSTHAEGLVQLGEGVAGRVAQESEPLLLVDEPDGDGRAASSIVHPLTHRERTIGVLCLARHAHSRPFRKNDLQLCSVLAGQAVLAMVNAQLVTELRDRVHEVETAHGRLAEQERLAAIGQLAAGVAHEINNPASYVLSNLWAAGEICADLAGVSELIEAQRPMTEVQAAWSSIGGHPALDDLTQGIQDATEGAQRITAIIRDMRDLAKVRGDTRVFSLNETLRGAIRLAGAAVRGRARIAVELEGDAHVCANSSRMSQVFLNLLVNAAEALDESGEHHRITVRSGILGDLAFASVTDTGPGIPADTLPLIFDPFFTTKDRTGTGMGLSLSRDFVREAGGRIRVSSAAGQGTTFTVELPLAVNQRDEVG